MDENNEVSEEFKKAVRTVFDSDLFKGVIEEHRKDNCNHKPDLNTVPLKCGKCGAYLQLDNGY